VLELNRARDLPRDVTSLVRRPRGLRQEDVSWRRRARSLRESFSAHTFMRQRWPSACGRASVLSCVRSARYVRGAPGMTDLRPSWLTCRSTTADSRTASVRTADRVFARAGSRSPSPDLRQPSRPADSLDALSSRTVVSARRRLSRAKRSQMFDELAAWRVERRVVQDSAC
jgi:hypothetical protein